MVWLFTCLLWFVHIRCKLPGLIYDHTSAAVGCQVGTKCLFCTESVSLTFALFTLNANLWLARTDKECRQAHTLQLLFVRQCYKQERSC